ncbi:MAG: DUF444 family protein, partial [Firmicutes bacterium]|nr:DUF444 family protein [Bacillota bacterium]
WHEEYPESDWNRYLLHFSDGDIFSDNLNALSEVIQEVLSQTNLLGYFEVESHRGVSPLWSVFQQSGQSQGHLHHALRMAKIESRDHILPAIRTVIAEQ